MRDGRRTVKITGKYAREIAERLNNPEPDEQVRQTLSEGKALIEALTKAKEESNNDG